MKFNKWYFKFLLIVVFIFAFYSSYYLYNYKKEELSRNLISRAETLSSSFSLYQSWNQLSLTGADVDNVYYQKIKQSLVKIKQVNPDLRFVYVLTRVGNNVVFVADSESSDSVDYSPPGQIYTEISPKVTRTFETKSSIIEGPYTDRWGTWVSSFAPIDNDINLIIGMDVNANEYKSEPIIFATIPGIVLLFIFFLIWIGSSIRSNEQKLIKMKSDFIAIASHDLRAPLTGIRWTIENLLTNKTIGDDIKRKLDSMRITSITLIELINELLDIKITELDMFNLPKNEYCLLSDVVLEVVNCQKIFADVNEITIKGYLDIPNLEIKGEYKKMYSVFNNIISNAVKYSRYGGQVVLKTDLAPDNSYIELSVMDSGIGIRKEDLSKIKAGFFRAENAKKHTTIGTGYGVYVSNLVLQAYGGSIIIESEEGKGTKVIIRLVVKK